MNTETDSLQDGLPLHIPDSIKSDYVKHQLYKQNKVLDIHTDMIQSVHIDGMQANMQTSILVYKFGGATIVLLGIIIALQVLILRKK